jgi:hypothetical protein
MTSARSVVTYLFAVLAALGCVAPGATAASDCSSALTAAHRVSCQHFQNTSSSAIAGNSTWQQFAAQITRGESATANPAQVSVGPDCLTLNGNFAGVQRRHQSAPEARGGIC